jgi:redox-sensing transcriptional repressor
MDRVIPKPTAKRLNLYAREVQMMIDSGLQKISSTELGNRVGVKSNQVRKDLAYLARDEVSGDHGRAGIGYDCERLLTRIEQLVGAQKRWSLALIGVGNIGRALLSYASFDAEGYPIAAVFDANESMVGKRIGRWEVKPMSQLMRTVKSRRIPIGILAVPRGAAQDLAEQLCAGGVVGLLNFAPMQLIVPPHVVVANIDLTITLKQLSMDIAGRQRADRGSRGRGKGSA